MKILLAVDGSDYSRHAAKYLAGHVSMFRTPPEITMATVHPSLPYKGAAGVLGKDAIKRYYREESAQVLKGPAKVLDGAGLKHDTIWMVGDAAAEITAYAKKERMDLIVMGSRGAGALSSLLLGSVAMKVIAASKIPVLIAR